MIPLKYKKMCYMFKQSSSPDKSTKIYTRKEIVIMETIIFEFHTSFYVPAIQKLAFRLPHVRILGTNHCGEMRFTAFKRSELFQDVLCRRDYAERLVAIFSNQIQSEYYGGNIFASIEGIELENSNDEINVKPKRGCSFVIFFSCFLVSNIDKRTVRTAPQYTFLVWKCMIRLMICAHCSICHI